MLYKIYYQLWVIWACNKCSEEQNEDEFIGQSQAPRELAKDRGYFKNKNCVVQYQGKLLRMLPPRRNNVLVFVIQRIDLIRSVQDQVRNFT